MLMTTPRTTSMLQFTPAAVEQLKSAIEASETVRVAVLGGGCAGMSYSLTIDSETDEEDLLMEFGHVKVCIDPHSAGILNETTIDYITSLRSNGFVFNNPNSNTTCGCGSSFS